MAETGKRTESPPKAGKIPDGILEGIIDGRIYG